MSRILCMAILFLTISHISMGQNQEWKLIKTNNKDDGWKAYKAKVPDSKLNQVKIIGKVNYITPPHP
ncbi:MAG: hypothetical protein ACI8XB_002257 [Patiriisocius sp.]|jgi:hypothetical protein